MRDPLLDFAREAGLNGSESQHFAVATDHTAVEAMRVCEIAERVHRRLDSLFGHAAPPGKGTIVWLESEALQSRAIARCGHRADSEALEGASGFFSGACGLIHLGRVPGDGSFERVASAIAHECVHQRLSTEGIAAVRGAGAWIDEGLATWAESLDLEFGVPSLSVERLAQARALAAAEMLLPLESFVSMSREALVQLRPVEVVYAQGGVVRTRWVSLHYVQSFVVIAWLEDLLQSRFDAFAKRAMTTGGTVHELEQSTRLNIDTLQHRFTEWIERDMKEKGVAIR